MQQGIYQVATDVAGAPGDEHVHACKISAGGVLVEGPELWAIPGVHRNDGAVLSTWTKTRRSKRLIAVLWLKLIQQLVKALNSDGTPGQVAAGIALGAALGLTPLMNLHNLLILSAIMLLNVSVPGAVLGWALFTPVGFVLDPWFDALGRWLLLDLETLRPLWVTMVNTPVLALANLNNTVVLGSLVVWLLAFAPLYVAARYGVAQYRARVYQRLRQTRAFQLIEASKLYNLYRLLRPE